MGEPEIVTERLKLSRFHDSDAPAFCRYRSEPEVCRYQSFEPGSLDDAQQFVREQKSAVFNTAGTWFQFAIRVRETDLLVGDLGVHFPADDSRQAEIGVTVDPCHQGCGLGAEAVRAVLHQLLGPLGKHRVFASVDPRNGAAIALLKKVGMRQEAYAILGLPVQWLEYCCSILRLSPH